MRENRGNRIRAVLIIVFVWIFTIAFVYLLVAKIKYLFR